MQGFNFDFSEMRGLSSRVFLRKKHRSVFGAKMLFKSHVYLRYFGNMKLDMFEFWDGNFAKIGLGQVDNRFSANSSARGAEQRPERRP